MLLLQLGRLQKPQTLQPQLSLPTVFKTLFNSLPHEKCFIFKQSHLVIMYFTASSFYNHIHTSISFLELETPKTEQKLYFDKINLGQMTEVALQNSTPQMGYCHNTHKKHILESIPHKQESETQSLTSFKAKDNKVGRLNQESPDISTIVVQDPTWHQFPCQQRTHTHTKKSHERPKIHESSRQLKSTQRTADSITGIANRHSVPLKGQRCNPE